MQRTTSSLRRTCLLPNGLLLSSTFPKTSNYTSIGFAPQSPRRFSVTRSVATPLPSLDFLHPPLIQDAVKRAKQQTRRYRAPSNGRKPYTREENEDKFVPSTQGWSEAEVHRQEELYRQQEKDAASDPADSIFKELDSIPARPQRVQTLPEQTWPENKPFSEHVSQLKSGSAYRLTKTPKVFHWDRYSPELSIERQSALAALRAIFRGSLEGKHQQAIDIYLKNELQAHLTAADELVFMDYLYYSDQRSYLEELIRLFPTSLLVVPTLCRLGRLEEAKRLALQRLWTSAIEPNFLSVSVVMDEFARRGQWEPMIELWEDAVMAPTIEQAQYIASSKSKNVVIENCLACIPNVKSWYIAKAARIITDSNVPAKLVEFIKILGGLLVKGLASNNQDIIGLDLLRYQVETFGEIDQNVMFAEMKSLRFCNRPKAAVELYLQYRNNEFATIEHASDSDPARGADVKLKIQNEAMASASMLNNFPVLKQVFEDIYTLNLEPDKYSYSVIMHAFARHGQAATVQQLFDTYQKSGREPDTHLYAELLYVQVILLDIPGVEKAFRDIAAAKLDSSQTIYDMLTTAYTRALDVDGAMHIFRAYIRQGNQPTRRLIGHLISMFANRNDPSAAVEMFNLLGEFGLSPDKYSFNQLLNAYANIGDRVNAEAVVARMREVGIQPDIVTWTTLLKMYVAREEISAMVDVLARMRRGGLEPNEFAWTQVITAFANLGGRLAVPNVRRIMNRMKSLGFRLNVFHWNGLLEAVMRSSKDLLELQRVYDEMLDSGVKPTQYTHALLVSAYCQYGGSAGLEIAEGILSRLTSITQHLDLTTRASPRTALLPGLFAPLFRYQGPKLPQDKVQEVFDSYVNSTASVGGSAAEPDLDLLVALLDVYRQHRDIEAVKRVWEAIKAHADNASRSFRSTSEEVTEFVVPGNRYMLCEPFSHYMRALADAGELDEIDTVWDQLGQDGYDFNCENWNTRISICLMHKKHIVWAFRACEEVLMDGWETRLRMARKKVKNPPKAIRERRVEKRLVNMVKRAIWPVEDDLLDLDPPPEDVRNISPELYVYQKTLHEFIMLRRELLLGTSIVDSAGLRRPGPEVWERLKQAFPRIVRAMLLYLKGLPSREQRKIALDFERDTDFLVQREQRSRGREDYRQAHIA